METGVNTTYLALHLSSPPHRNQYPVSVIRFFLRVRKSISPFYLQIGPNPSIGCYVELPNIIANSEVFDVWDEGCLTKKGRTP